MVYGGRPSRGCETCRQRRIKCDERKPSCAQCEKSKRVCRGYRDVLNLLFRSENEGVEKRVRRTQPEQVHYLLPQEPEQLALNYFFNNYVLIPRKSDAAHGYMEVLPVLYANLAPNSPLLSATSALAFAAFGKDAFGRQFFPNTRLKYGEAIARLNEALGDPVAVRKDETLMAVLIMGMVEIATSVATSFGNTHTDGAAAIIRLRGREIFASETSTRLFHHTRIQMALRQIEEPAVLEKTDREGFMEMMESEFSLHDEQSVTDTLTRLMLRLPKIRMLADNLFRETRSESTTQATLQLIECCQHLDNALSTWREATPEDWQYTSQPNSLSILADLEPETPKVYPSTVDVYPDVWTVKAWNSYRTTRIIVQAIILRSVAWLAADGIQDVRVIQQMAAALQARQIIQEMVDEICASAPFHLGQVTIQSLESASTFGNRPHAKVLKSVEDPTIEHLGGYFLLRPLYIARSTRIIPNEQKMWIGVQLLNIATRLGLDEEPIFTKLSEHPAQGLFGLEGSWAP